MGRERRIWSKVLICLTVIPGISCLKGCHYAAEHETREQMAEMVVTFSEGSYLSKAIDPDEHLISDINLLVFNNYGELEDHIWMSGLKSGSKPCCRTELIKGTVYSFFACANFGHPIKVNGIEELQEIDFHLAYPDEYREGMPMCCFRKDVRTDGSGTICLSLERMMAKISLRMDRSRLSEDVGISVTGLRIGNCPKRAKALAPSKIETHDDCFPVGFVRTVEECDMLNVSDADGLSGYVTLYMLENMQGRFDVDGITEDNDKVLDEDDPRSMTCSYMEIRLEYLSSLQYTAQKPLIYRFYLGDGLNSLDVERNCHYRISVCPEDDGLRYEGWRVDKSGIGTFVKEVTLADRHVDFTYIGETAQMTARILPSEATLKELEWDSSDWSVAGVSPSGKITAMGEGTCTITCRSTDGGGAEASCTVSVTQGQPYLISYPQSYIRGDIGEQVHIWCDYFPPNAPFDIGISYMEDDKAAGIYDYTLDEDGKGATLTLKGPGRGLIYMEAGVPINDAAMFVIEVNLPQAP